jgi:hypothetical protein
MPYLTEDTWGEFKELLEQQDIAPRHIYFSPELKSAQEPGSPLEVYKTKEEFWYAAGATYAREFRLPTGKIKTLTEDMVTEIRRICMQYGYSFELGDRSNLIMKSFLWQANRSPDLLTFHCGEVGVLLQQGFHDKQGNHPYTVFWESWEDWIQDLEREVIRYQNTKAAIQW